MIAMEQIVDHAKLIILALLVILHQYLPSLSLILHQALAPALALQVFSLLALPVLYVIQIVLNVLHQVLIVLHVPLHQQPIILISHMTYVSLVAFRDNLQILAINSVIHALHLVQHVK